MERELCNNLVYQENWGIQKAQICPWDLWMQRIHFEASKLSVYKDFTYTCLQNVLPS